MNRRLVLNRRTFLRGVFGATAVAVALPPLEAMFDATGTALAGGGGAVPKRMGVWFWGNGIRPERWVPTGTGTGWTASEELEPLTRIAGLRDYVSVVTGCEVKTQSSGSHPRGAAAILTGRETEVVGRVRDTVVSTASGPTIDQVVARRWYDEMAMRTPIRSLEVGVCSPGTSDEGSLFMHASHNGPNAPNPAEFEPRVLFNRLFGVRPDAQIASARASVLDAVRGDLAALRQRVSAADRARLDAHAESIRNLEHRLGATAGVCTPPAMPPALPALSGGREPIEEKSRAMSDLLAMALACDLTRVFTLQFSITGAQNVFWMCGATDSQHQVSHDEGAPHTLSHRSIVFVMEQLAYFLDRLRSYSEGAGNLLDSCAILGSSDLSNGHEHLTNEFPIVIAGRAGGSLRGGVHYRSGAAENTSNALLTLLRACGDPRPSFGADAGLSSTVIAPLLAAA